MTNTQLHEPHHKTRKEWIDQAKQKLDEWDQAVDQLEARATELKLDAKSGVQAKLKATKQSLVEVRGWWSKVAGEVNQVWDTVSGEVGAAWEVNKAAFERSLEEIRSTLR